MIQGTTETTFSAYITTEDNRIDTSVVTSKLRYLFKITNDMDGSIYYVYPEVISVYPRTTHLSIKYSATPDMYLHQVKLIPSGHYKYEVYEVSWIGTPTLTETTAPATETTILPVSNANGIVQGIVTKGILNMTDKAGTEQVQYTQREAPASTNYIYYGQ
tara:strand:- start:204 stop:683 length:480 start_codon:yes stop_codon:yes gene_type:complete